LFKNLIMISWMRLKHFFEVRLALLYVSRESCVQWYFFEPELLIWWRWTLTDSISLNGDASSSRDSMITHWVKEFSRLFSGKPVGWSYGVTTSFGWDRLADWITFHRRMRLITRRNRSPWRNAMYACARIGKGKWCPRLSCQFVKDWIMKPD